MYKFIKVFIILSIVAMNAFPETVSSIEEALIVIENSDKGDDIEEAAKLICKIENRDAIEKLVLNLKEAEFLSRMDSPNDYTFYRHRLRVRRVLEYIAKISNSEMAELCLLELSRDSLFMSDKSRVKGIIVACGLVDSPSLELIKFLHSYVIPKGRHANLAMRSLVNFKTMEAFEIVKSILLSESFRPVKRCSWLVNFILPIRYHEQSLNLYERLLMADIDDQELRNCIVQSLFDYKPSEWYGDHSEVKEPELQKASTKELNSLLFLSDLALKFDIDDDTINSLKDAREEINKILTER